MSEIEDKYNETLEQLFFTTRKLTIQERKQEFALLKLDELRGVISEFESKVDTLQGERKNNALKTIYSLKSVFDGFGGIYLQELYWRKKNYENEEALIFAANRIEQLEKELETISKASNEIL